MISIITGYTLDCRVRFPPEAAVLLFDIACTSAFTSTHLLRNGTDRHRNTRIQRGIFRGLKLCKNTPTYETVAVRIECSLAVVMWFPRNRKIKFLIMPLWREFRKISEVSEEKFDTFTDTLSLFWSCTLDLLGNAKQWQIKWGRHKLENFRRHIDGISSVSFRDNFYRQRTNPKCQPNHKQAYLSAVSYQQNLDS